MPPFQKEFCRNIEKQFLNYGISKSRTRQSDTIMESSSIIQCKTELSTSQESGKSEESVESTNETENTLPTFDFTETSWRSDFVLVVEGARLHVAKNILSLASPVFDRLLQSEFKEKSSDELELPGKKKADVLEFLRCIYPNIQAHLTYDNALNVLPLADEYQILHLKERCEHALIEGINSDTSAMELVPLLRAACMYDLAHLREKCIDLASEKQREDLDEAQTEINIPAEALNEILEKVMDKLRIRIVELETSNESLTKRNETLELSATSAVVDGIALAEELEVMKQYLSADLKDSKELGLDGKLNWKTEQIVFILNVKSKGAANVKEVVIWGIPLKIYVSVTDNLHLRVDYNSKNGKIDCKFVFTSIFVNRQPWGRNETVRFEDKFYWSSITRTLKKINEMNEARHGFMRDGKIGLILHIYMSEPNKE